MTLSSEPRRHFRLPESDEAFLDPLGVRWETIVENGLRWLLLHEAPLPAGYNYSTTDIAINIAPGYPPGALDMAYFCPPLARVDERPIPQTQAIQILDGRSWQRWSRHRTSENPWVEGEDDLATHVHYMQAWLVNEFSRAA